MSSCFLVVILGKGLSHRIRISIISGIPGMRLTRTCFAAMSPARPKRLTSIVRNGLDIRRLGDGGADLFPKIPAVRGRIHVVASKRRSVRKVYGAWAIVAVIAFGAPCKFNNLRGFNGGTEFESHPLRHSVCVQSGEILYRTFRRHSLHPWAKRVI